MKVILTQTVPKVGKEGQVAVVADGYARNYLFPRGLAIVADKSQMKSLERRHERMAAKLAETKAGAEKVKEKLEGLEIKIEGKVGLYTGKLFGAITAQDIADAIKAATKVEVDKKQVGLLEPIKRLGEYKIEIDLHREVDARVHLSVYDPDAPVEVVVAEEEVATEEVSEEAAPGAEPEAVEA